MQQLESPPESGMSQTNKQPLQYIITIEPLGLLYGSAGRFLSPENLVGRSGTSFPPSAATLSGLFAASYQRDSDKLRNLQLAGPFWAKRDNPHNFYVPTPLNCLVKDGKIQHVMAWHPKPKRDKEQDDNQLKGWWKVWKTGKNGELGHWKRPPDDKYDKNTWLAIEHWMSLQNPPFPPVESGPWKFVPHLHPRLKKDERRVVDPQDDEENNQGSLFLENGVQLHPDTCLVYLSNTEITEGCYRFGGEGHLVDLRCQEMGKVLKDLLSAPLGRSFATITPAVWGSNRRSTRTPECDENDDLSWYGNALEALLTQRPSVFRYRLGNSNDPRPGAPKRLSRGRYAVPAGTVYVLEEELQEEFNLWEKWPEDWFPEEGISYKRFGCGLSLPMESAIANSGGANG